MTDLSLTKVHFSTKVYRCYLFYLRTYHPNIDVRQLCLDAGLSYEYLTNENNWVSVVFDERFTRLCIERTGEKDLCYRVGSLMATQVGLGRVLYLVLKYSVSLDFLYRSAPGVSNYVSRVTDFQVRSISRCAITIRFSAKGVDTLTPAEKLALLHNFDNIFRNSIGHLGSWPALHGLPPANVTHTVVETSPDGFPVYDIHIRYSVPRTFFSSLQKHLMSLAGVVLGAAGVILANRVGWIATWRGEVEFWSCVASLGFVVDCIFKLRAVNNALASTARDYELLDRRYESLQVAKTELQEAAEVNARYRHIVDQMHLGLLVLEQGPGGKWATKPFLQNAGFNLLRHKLPEETSARLVEQLIERYGSRFVDVAVGGRAHELQEWKVVGNAGETVISVIAFAVDGGRIGIILEDVTAQSQAALALEEERAKSVQSAKMAALGEMAAAISHELNNPLAIVIGKCEPLVKEEKVISLGAKETAARAERILVAALRMGRIIKNIRGLAREVSRDPMERHSLNRILKDTLELCEWRLSDAGVDLKTFGFEEEKEVVCRDVEITQILVNLLNNACDAVKSCDRKEIRIELTETDGTYCISVQDNGPGIPAPVRESLFRPFFTTKDPGKGTGLGLNISRQIAEKHGGTLLLDPQSSQTRFVLVLPKAGGRVHEVMQFRAA